MNSNKLLSFKTRSATQEMLLNYLVGRFKWEGLPDGITSEILEYYLNIQGQVSGFRTNNKFVLLPSSPTGEKNLMWMDIKFIAYGYNATFNIDINNSVCIHNNPSHTGFAESLEIIAKDLDEIIFAQRVNINQQRNPWAFGGTSQEVESLKAALAKRDENGSIMFVSKNMMGTLDNGKRFSPINVNLIANDLHDAYIARLNDFLTLIGMDNNPVHKKERLITDEAHSNDSVVLYNRKSQLREREKACVEINNKFRTNLSVKWVGCSDCEGGEENGNSFV